MSFIGPNSSPGAARAFAGSALLDGHSLRIERHRGRPKVPYHYHDLCELLLLRGGRGERIVGDRFSTVEGRDLILVGPALPHGWLASPETADEADMEFVVVLFTRESLGLELLAKREFADVAQLVHRASRGLAWPAAVARQVEDRLFGLEARPPSGQLLVALEVLGILAQAPAEELVSRDYNVRGVEREHAALAAVLELIQTRGRETISLRQAARSVHMSVPSFTRFFRRMTGTSFIDHLNEWRIRQACAMLRTTDDRVLDVAVRCGFHNLSHFNRQFRRRRGMSPVAWRKRRQGSKAADQQSSS